MTIVTLAKGLVFPIVLVGSTWAFHWLLSAGIDGGLALFAISLANLVVVAGLELIFPLRRDWAWFRDAQAVNDLIHGGLLSTLGPRLGEIALASVVASGASAMASGLDGGLWPSEWPLWAQLTALIVAADFVEWVKHWGYHTCGVMWPIHALHHSASKMHVMKAARLHFLESTIRYTIITAPLLVLGAGPELFLWYAALLNFVGNLNHSNIDMPMPRFLHYLFATPQVHRLHHEIDPHLGRSNLSSLTMLPDLLFGTFRHPDEHALTRVGIDDDPIPGNLFAQLASPFIWRVLARRRPRAAVARTPQL